MVEWHIITSEYPPRTGGVSDYTRIVAEGLSAAGDAVHVWCPPVASESRGSGVSEASAAAASETHGAGMGEFHPTARGLTIHRELGTFAPSDWRRAGRLLNESRAPRRLLVQYVPHGYGYRAMNLALCLWLWKRARVDGDEVQIMLHEPFLELGGNWRQRVAACVQRLMAALLLNCASHVWTATRAWEDLWRPYAFGRRVEFEWLPVPCTVPVACDAAKTAGVRALCAPRGVSTLVGHLGTYPRHVAEQLNIVLPALLMRNPSASALLLGRGSVEARDELIDAHPSLAARIHATGVLPAHELSAHLAACDLLVQPFTDGVSTRRTSVMAGLAHGISIVTTRGRLTEKLWAESGAVKLAPVGDLTLLVKLTHELLADAAGRSRLGTAARAFYQQQFDLKRTIDVLRYDQRQRTKRAA